jgi:hypothetical protein
LIRESTTNQCGARDYNFLTLLYLVGNQINILFCFCTYYYYYTDITCSSKYAYRRIAGLYSTAIAAAEEDRNVRLKLCTGLCHLLRNAGDIKLLEDTRQGLPLSNPDMLEIFAETSKESGIPAFSMLPPPYDWELFAQHSANQDPAASAVDMDLSKTLLQAMDLEAWEQTVGPMVVLKLKAKPETVIDMVEGLTRHIQPNVVVQSKLVVEELVPVLMKQIKSSKEIVRDTASLVLQHLGGAAIKASKTEDAQKCLAKIVQALAETKTLTLIHQRQAVYVALREIGIQMVVAKTELDAETISNVVSGICTPLAKEVKTATEVRDQGVGALLRWMVIAKRNGGSKGFDEALTYIRKPVIAKNGPDSLFVLGAMVQLLHPDLVESLILDLWKEAKFVSGLEALVEAANKKQASASSIPQVEGLLAVYVGLVHAAASSSSKLSPVFEKAVSAGPLSVEKTSFVYGDAITKATATNPVVSQILPQIIAMYTKISSASGAPPSKTKATSAVSRAMACSITHPFVTGNQSPTGAIESAVQAVLDYQPVADALTEALFRQVNQLSLDAQELGKALNETRQAREDEKGVSIKGKCSITGSHRGMDVNSVRRIARKLASRSLTPKSLAMVMILMHAGSSLRTTGKQRTSLVSYTTQTLKDVVTSQGEKVDEVISALADLIAEQAACAHAASDESRAISDIIHLASMSLIKSLGGIACNFLPATDDPNDEEMKPFAFANRLCTKEIAPRLAETVKSLTLKIESLSETDADVYKSPLGSLFRAEDMSKKKEEKVGGKGRRTEDEEWELQMKKELAKKKAETESSTTLSAEDKKRVQEQDVERKRIGTIMEAYDRAMAAVESLADSDIEVGNSCLTVLSEGVLNLAVSDCPAVQFIPGMQEKSLATLTTLATCVYEISEEYAKMMAMALVISYRKVPQPEGSVPGAKSSEGLKISPLPSPCEPAATTVFEMDEFQEELSGASFAFLFPVVWAALMGPRTTPGCEGALRVLERHTIMLAGEEKDPFVAPLRVDMVASVLELLKNDRAQTFVDPTPYETLVACYRTDDEADASGPVLSTAELAALLDERGALGSRSCRVASMIALGSIAASHKKIVKNNPLIENRIWMNCFEKNDSIRTEARRTWGIIHDSPGLEDSATGASLPPPSPMYAIPLLPLLSSEDKSIAEAAPEAFAQGMAAHPNSVNRNIQKLCSAYIDSWPAPGGSESKSASPFPSIPAAKPVAAPPKKKMMMKTQKKSALAVAGIGLPKKSKKKSAAVSSALLKPKQERTLDHEALVGQFKTGPQKVPPEQDTPAKIAARRGILRALAALTSANVQIDIQTLTLLTSFLMAYGIADADEGVKGASRNSLRDVVASYGSSDEAIAFLLPHLEKILKTGVADKDTLGELSKDKIPEDTAASDGRKEGAVVALGSVALHLKGPENASKIDATVDMLLQSLKTPSEDVQASVADALAKLMKKGNTQERIEPLLHELVENCLHSDSAPIRRGAAYGIAAAVKGSGIAALKKYGIVTKLEEACASGTSTSKEGSLFAIELLCTRLGLLFEPYVIVLLPSLLKSFSDSSDHVRKAASHAVGLIMSKLSAHGVKLVMPAVLTAFNDKAWQTKQASIHMLGSMCHLAPKQLAQALPKVVPNLIEAFSDTHPKVKSSAKEALDEISTVIRNPEISSLSPVLLKALTDPADNTLAALEALISTEFLHAIDAPSLALVVPILHRGLRDRTATTKRYGALITGNICTMINDPRDFVPYLPTLIPDLQDILLDPIPDVRSISAKAFGSLTRGLGEDTLPDLRPWLLERLRSDEVSSAERSGAAQGLTEVLIASGTSVVESVIFDDILPLKSHPSASTREGVLWVLVFLPPALGQGFTPMLDACLPVLIGGLSDDHEQVREVGMRAGRVMIKSHGRVHYNKILPILQNGMRDVDHRIRLSSLTLTGDLLSMIGGTSVLRTDGDTQDDVRKAEKAQAQITLTLGMETRNHILGDIYLARNDSSIAVRQTAVQVWKTIVSVTARTLRQILSVLVTRVVTDLASGDAEKTEVAGKCLGDIVSKLGDSVLPEVIPVLRNSLDDGDSFTRRGVCVGLSEVIGSSTKDQILRFLDIIVKVVQDALCDDDESVRQMAATSFQNLFFSVGSRAMDEVVPALMVALESSASDDVTRARALNGLTGILSIRSKELLPYIIPRLIEAPITSNHAKALGSIAGVTGGTIHFHFNSIIPALMNDLANQSDDDTDREGDVRECVRSLFENADEAGVNWLVSEIASKSSSDKAEMRRESCWMLETVIVERKFFQARRCI